jgi:hypothetical protein
LPRTLTADIITKVIKVMLLLVCAWVTPIDVHSI